MNIKTDTTNKRMSKTKRKQIMIGLAFLLPAITATLLFKYYPIVRALSMSFFEYKTVFIPGKFIWFENYKTLFSIGLFWKSWSNTFFISIYALIFSFFTPILQAISLSYINKLKGALRVCYLLPIVVPGVVGAFLWRWIYDPSNGALNSIIGLFGISPQTWLNDPNLVKICLTLPGLLGGGIAILIYLAAIEGIPQELYEAADIDGIGAFKKIYYILLPNIRFVIGIQFVMLLIGVLQIFDQPFIMTGGGPVDQSRVAPMLVYDYAFRQYKFGLASAAAMISFIVIILVTIPVFRYQNKTAQEG